MYIYLFFLILAEKNNISLLSFLVLQVLPTRSCKKPTPVRGTPPHRHSRENESFYVLEGAIEFQLDERTVTATAGTFLHSPQGQLHRFTNITTTPAKILIWVTPAGFEKFIAEVGKVVDGQVTPAPTLSPADLEKILATAPKYGIEIIPPPSA
jgi:mannose-6-phosphate isomerase-like protein (cupin superfamily)